MQASLQRISFGTRLFVSLLVFSLALLSIVGGYISSRMQDQLYTQMGNRALVQAKEISVIPSLVQAVQRHDAAAIRQLITRLRSQTDANYIVIGDNHGNHLFHTEEITLTGPMVGGDNDAVLHGESIISIRRGTLGISMRGKAPIFDEQHNVIGIVSVGYLQHHIEHMRAAQLAPLLGFLLILLLALFAFSLLFTRSIKRQMFGLEPREISRLVRQQEAVFEAIFEGVIAMDTHYRITAINHAARVMLGIGRGDSASLIGKTLPELVTPTDFFCDPDNTIADKHDEVCHFNQLSVIASRVRILINDQLRGWVITFRDKNDINTLSLQLSQVRRYADNLRVMRHEHLNWSATLSGLLHLQRYDEATRLIEAQSAGSQKVLDYVSAHFMSPSICGLLLGKYSRARELGLELVFDPACQLQSIPALLDETELMSIVGNLLDNAFDAMLRLDSDASNEQESQRIELYISDTGDDLIVEVADQGSGIDETIRHNMFERGVTTHDGGDHGIGLYLVAKFVAKAHGTITVDDNTPRGSIFSIFIPKTPQPEGLTTQEQAYVTPEH